MAVQPAGVGATVRLKRRSLKLLDLPRETQEEIVSHCSQTDLICLALVSKHCRELAAAQLYRNFHIIFPDDDDASFDSPIDGLAGGLDTFTTSDYDYAQHLKDLSMDTLSAGAKGERSYQSYLYSASCGKFLNTLLCLTLKKARALESFRWNIRVELSRPVYQTLHKLATLRNLHIRMQAGESYYSPPPPLPASLPVPSSSQLSSTAQTQAAPNAAPPPLFSNSPPTLSPPSRFLPKSRASKNDNVIRDPPTFSGFSNLRGLSILDIDDLDIVPELAACVEGSSSTLTELRLSFSSALASRARKPIPDSDLDDSDVDDEFQIEIVPVPHSPTNDASGAFKAFRAQEERKVHEAILGKVLGVEDSGTQHSQREGPKAQGSSDANDDVENTCIRDPRKVFIQSIKAVSAQLLKLLNGPSDLVASQQEILDTIERAARKYVESGDAIDGQSKDEASTSLESVAHSLGSSLPTAQEPSQAGGQSGAGHGMGLPFAHPSGESEDDGSLQNDTEGSSLTSASQWDIITDEAYAGVDDTVRNRSAQTSNGQHVSSAEASRIEPSETPNPTSDDSISVLAVRKMRLENMLAKYRQLQNLLATTQAVASELQYDENSTFNDQTTRARAELHTITAGVASLDRRIHAIRTEIEAMEKQIVPKSPGASAELVRRCMNKYVLQTRGLPLDTLAIHLIPVKATVLSRAINLRCLKQLTLLNVGSQAPIWNLLARENRISPLPLRSVFTDNASIALLNFLGQLTVLHDLFMLERSQKYRPESFAPRTTTTMKQIRTLVLSKHLPTLRRLMIRDDSSKSNWDANMKTVAQICKRGTRLEELGLSMDIRAMVSQLKEVKRSFTGDGRHALAQLLPSLVNLRALHIIHFRNDDTCHWVMRESLRFMVDSLSHRPELKVEWVAIAEDGVHRIIRNSEEADNGSEEESDRGNHTGVKATWTSTSLPGAYPVLPTIPTDSDTDSDDEALNEETLLKCRTFGPIQFHDVWGVKIFEKEMRTGYL